MNFNELKEFIANKMRMQHVYQPVMITTLFESGNTASVRQIQKASYNWMKAKLIMRKDKTVIGFNVGFNDGEDVGETVFHCHIHVIPRRRGVRTRTLLSFYLQTVY